MLLNINEVLNTMITNKGRSIAEISQQSPIMLVFLRHFGCQFCRQGMDELSIKRPELAKIGTELIFVHMAEAKIAEEYFARFNLHQVEHVSDVFFHYYIAFGLAKGTFSQLFGLQTWIKGFTLQFKYGNEFGKHLGDSFQMPGVFMIHEGVIKEQFIHRSVADRPDYEKLANCCIALK